MRLAWPPGYYRIENDSALAAAAYVTQISFDLAALFTRCYFGLGHFTGLRLLSGILLFLNAVMLGLIVASTITSGPMLFPASVGLFLFPFLEVSGSDDFFVSSRHPTLNTRRNDPLCTLWSSLAAGCWVPPLAIIMVKRGPLIAILYVWLSAFLRAFLHGAFNSPTWMLLYHAGSLVVAPILMFGMLIRLWPQTGAKLTDPDQMVPFCSAIVMILYQWRPMLTKWYWRVLEIVSRAFSYRRASGVTTETATQGGG
jgi:hypothetical protein